MRVEAPPESRRHVYVEQTVGPCSQPSNGCHQLRDCAVCLGLYQVCFVETFRAEDGSRVICHFTAPDLESVRLALRNAGVTADAIWARI